MLKKLLRDRRVGTNTPVTMALVLRLVAALAKRKDLDPIARASLQLIELAAADALAATAGEVTVGSRSARRTRLRLEELFSLAGYEHEIAMEADADVAHEPLTPTSVRLRRPRTTIERIGDALYYMRDQAQRNTAMQPTTGFICTSVVLRLERYAEDFDDPDVDRRALARAAAESIAPDLGELPSIDLVERCLGTIARDHGKWVPLSELFGLDKDSSGAGIETLKKHVRRWKKLLVE